jgi:hypothetical protein
MLNESCLFNYITAHSICLKSINYTFIFCFHFCSTKRHVFKIILNNAYLKIVKAEN